MKIRKDELLGRLPPEWPVSLLPQIQELVTRLQTKIVVLDDDPTGTQTVHHVTVLTEWSLQSLTAVLAEPDALVYILTNSRSFPLIQAEAINREIASNLVKASAATGRRFLIVSRSDSTLRGHFPGEVLALAEALGSNLDGILVVPFFLEGGRLTIDDTHYVAEGDWLVPAAETEYARDATFGYRHSDLRAWISDKYQGRVLPAEVASITLDDLRRGGPEAVEAVLIGLVDRKLCVVNAASYRDMEVFVAGLLRAEARGKRFICRTAASFVRVRGGLTPRERLQASDLPIRSQKRGLIIGGSYIKKSTAQIRAVQDLPGIVSVQVSVDDLLDAERAEAEIRRVAGLADRALSSNRDVLVFTSRQLVAGADETASLRIGQAVSTGLVEIVDRIKTEPAWVIAKGGITSSDIATRALNVKRALVLGQAIPGVPVWQTGSESRWPGLVYVVFPGNVGEPDSIAEMVKILRAAQ